MELLLTLKTEDCKKGTPRKSGFYAVKFYDSEKWSVVTFSKKYNSWYCLDKDTEEEHKKDLYNYEFLFKKKSEKYIFLTNSFVEFDENIRKEISKVLEKSA